jgi:GNAT superfamily N-acetyltransferase
MSNKLNKIEMRRLDESRVYHSFVLDRFEQMKALKLIPARPRPDDESQVILLLNDVGTPVAFAIHYRVNGKRLWLDILWVEPAWRRLGAGLRLLEHLEQICRRENQRAVMLGHSQDNEPMAALAAKAGWPVDHIVRSKEMR